MSLINIPNAGSTTTQRGTFNNVAFGDGQGSLYSLGQDTIYGGSGPDAMVAEAGANDLVIGGTGQLTFTAGSGNNVVFSGPGGLEYSGSTGFDVVVGNGHPVDIHGGSGGGDYFGGGNSTIRAGGSSVLVGTTGDKLYGGGTANDLFGVTKDSGNILLTAAGSTGNNVFFGTLGTGPLTFITGNGNDILGLGQGTNNVTLGAGHDTVFANTGTTGVSTITAGTGSADIGLGGASVDLFIAALPDQSAVATAHTFNLFNYVPGADKITLTGFSSAEATNALASQTNVNGSAVLTLSDHSKIVLVGVAQANSSLFG